jgi:hypothetical protein
VSDEKRLLKVFLCHASQDKPVVRDLYLRLKAKGWTDTWLDEKKLLPGQDWRSKIEEAVEISDIVIICLSNNSVSKTGFVQKELRYAKEIALEKPEETIFLIPLRFDECDVPKGLRIYHWVDYFGEKKDEAFSALLESLELRLNQKLAIEEKKRARQEMEKREREAAEKIAHEKAEREAAEKEAQEKAEQEKVAHEKAERESVERAASARIRREAIDKAAREKTEKTALEKEKREATEKAKRERAGRQSAQINALKGTLSKLSVNLKSTLVKATSFIKIVGIIGIIVILFWISSRAMPKLTALVPTTMKPAAIILTQTPTATFTVSPPSVILRPILTPSKTLTATMTILVISKTTFTPTSEIRTFRLLKYSVTKKDTFESVSMYYTNSRKSVIAIKIAIGLNMLLYDTEIFLPVYTIRSGDNLYKISTAFGISQKDIIESNGITNPDFLIEGQNLILPINCKNTNCTPFISQ